MHVHFWSRDKDHGGHNIQSAIAETPSACSTQQSFKDVNGNVSASGAIWQLNVKIKETVL